jgi:nucleoid-associated protein YgaU
MQRFKYVILALIFIMASCASTPEEEPAPPVVTEEPKEEPAPVVKEEPKEEPAPVVKEEPKEEPAPVVKEEPKEEPKLVVEPFDQELISRARNKILLAEEARASTYFPLRLTELKSALSKINQTKDSDPNLARILYNEFDESSNSLINDSWKALREACVNILNEREKQINAFNGKEFTPVEYKLAITSKNIAIESFNTDNFAKAVADYRIAYTELTNLYNSLSNNKKYLDSLFKRIERLYTDGVQLEANKWAKEDFDTAYNLYNRGIEELYTNYNAISGEKLLLDTLYYGRKAIEQTIINKKVYETDQEILRLLSELEEASTLTVVDLEDNIISPSTWKGEASLKDKPIEASVEIIEESGLEEIDLDRDIDVEFPGVVKIISGETRVLGITETRKNLLEQAKEYWELGIKARNSGDLLMAKEYLDKSQIFLDEYKSMAVSMVYTVVLNIEDRDCLWKIAGREEFYGDPYLWPLIWERNKKLIQDPDLIYPGWKLIIPPLK